jgi:cytochrome P450
MSRRNSVGPRPRATAEAVFAFDPASPTLRDDPYPCYARMRSTDPVHWFEPRDGNGVGRWMLFRHDDVVTALTDPRFGRRPRAAPGGSSTSARPPSTPFFRMISDWMLFQDAPRHTRLRGHTARAFTPRAIERFRPRAVEIADELLGSATRDGALDLVADFAFPLPLLVIAEILGAGVDRPAELARWSKHLAAAIDAGMCPAVLADAERTTAEMREYFEQLVAERRASPRDDLISRLLAGDGNGDGLTDDEIFATCTFVLCAGHETTTGVLCAGFLGLLDAPDEFERLRADPSLLDRAGEELARFASPVQITSRVLHDDIELGGKRLSAGEHVDVVLGSANRDPEVFAEPDRFRLDRPAQTHVAYGAGHHFCLGAALARLEVSVALGALLARAKRPRLLAEPVWRDSLVLRGPTCLKLALV